MKSPRSEIRPLTAALWLGLIIVSAGAAEDETVGARERTPSQVIAESTADEWPDHIDVCAVAIPVREAAGGEDP